MTPQGNPASFRRIEAVLDPRELDHKLVDGCMFVTLMSACLMSSDTVPSRHVGRATRCPEALTVSAAVGEGTGYADSADGIELVCIKEHLGLQGLRVGSGPEPVRRDSVHDRGSLIRGDALLGQIPVGPLRGNRSVITTCGLRNITPPIVEQRGCVDDL